ncbi:MAG: hypothetical protein LRY51_00765, partial [Geovibrio sp.]|nr:hypothetical protein [Geovibrio sp.]
HFGHKLSVASTCCHCYFIRAKAPAAITKTTVITISFLSINNLLNIIMNTPRLIANTVKTLTTQAF